MKRGRILIIFLLVFSLLSLALIHANEEMQVQKAYNWLENKTNTTAKCTSLTLDERIFSHLATGINCKNEILLENTSTPCWPKSGCTVKTTAKAVLALNEDIDTENAEKWLLQQTTYPSTMEWFLEIDSTQKTTCLINYSNPQFSSNKIVINEDKKINTNAGNYLTLAQNNYWLKIDESLYNKKINITCDQPFVTALLFRMKGSSTINVLNNAQSLSANGKSVEVVESLCFKENGACNYESSLWATLALYIAGYRTELKQFMPYLISMKDDTQNQYFLPESFLYFMTGEFREDLLLKQQANSYWQESGNKYYDTALALFPLYNEYSTEKDNAKIWILENQLASGAWESNNLRDTSFILYSVWPKNPIDIYTQCTIDADCPSYSCSTRSCEYGVCFSYEFSCEDDDGCCPSGCTIDEDNDCTEEANTCTKDKDCEDLYYETDYYCSKDNVKVLYNVSDWTCKNKECVEKETIKTYESCLTGEECYAGECLDSGIITQDECVTDLDCEGAQICVLGYCTLMDCQENGYFCMSEANCEGLTLSDYACSGAYSCCDTEPKVLTCDDEGGQICSSEQYCFEGTEPDVSGLEYGETCCVGGTCEVETIDSADCYDNDGTCRESCESSEEESSGYTCDFGDVCCVAKEPKSSYLWVWILLILIVLTLVGILFRDKLRVQILKLKTMFGKKDTKKPTFGMPMPLTSTGPPRMIPRRIIPSEPQAPQIRKIPQMNQPSSRQPVKKTDEKSKSELDDVLKKLKEMGK